MQGTTTYLTVFILLIVSCSVPPSKFTNAHQAMKSLQVHAALWRVRQPAPADLIRCSLVPFLGLSLHPPQQVLKEAYCWGCRVREPEPCAHAGHHSMRQHSFGIHSFMGQVLTACMHALHLSLACSMQQQVSMHSLKIQCMLDGDLTLVDTCNC